MAATIIDGKAIAEQVKGEVAVKVDALKAQGVTPGLATVLVGDDAASKVYVSSKRKTARALGMKSVRRVLPAGVSQTELLDVLNGLNDDSSVTGILLQLPLPPQIDARVAVDTIEPSKDVDGLTSVNAGLLTLGSPRFVPCTPLGVKVLLERSGIKIAGANVVIVGRSNLVGRPLSVLLSLKSTNATVTLCHTGTTNLEEHTRAADILVVAAGVARGITGDMIKPGATVIDVGINKLDDGSLVGDVDFESASKMAGAITPVPGGVGPMTVAMLMSNTVDAAFASKAP